MSSTITRVLTSLLQEDDLEIPEWHDDTVLLDSGLDSLGFAVLVSRLEDELGYDPFTINSQAVYPRTLKEFVDVYSENVVK